LLANKPGLAFVSMVQRTGLAKHGFPQESGAARLNYRENRYQAAERECPPADDSPGG
jgi:hypothetical protein